MVRWLLIPLWCIAAAVGYGVLHDLVTANVCVEYFTIGHPRVIDSESPVAMALLWGILGSWWAGLILSVPATVAARVGSRPKWEVADLIRPTLVLLGCLFVLAMVSLVTGYVLSRNGIVTLQGRMAEFVPAVAHHRFLGVGFAHVASYGGGFVGGLILAGWIWRERGLEAGEMAG